MFARLDPRRARPGRPGTSTLTITAQPNGPTGTFTLTVTGTGGGKMHSQPVTLTLTP